MTSIDLTHVQSGAAAAGVTEAAGTDRWSTAAIPPKVIDRAVSHGRLLRSQAIAAMTLGMGRWLYATARSALGRRATTKLGCGDCGDMMRA
ncbi:hypothetical protein [Thalassobaculum salexigens]|uniref:hypothetical protein n=1 Tax=Thalassobaculum salexigens TaxID=455360 RepID=UPI000404896F|nr:hypothetical protein [Thalassobaculum salexigens]